MVRRFIDLFTPEEQGKLREFAEELKKGIDERRQKKEQERRESQAAIKVAAVTSRKESRFWVANPELENEISRLENKLQEIQEKRKKREQEQKAAEEKQEAMEASPATLEAAPERDSAREEAIQNLDLETEQDSEVMEEADRVEAEAVKMTEEEKNLTLETEVEGRDGGEKLEHRRGKQWAILQWPAMEKCAYLRPPALYRGKEKASTAYLRQPHSGDHRFQLREKKLPQRPPPKPPDITAQLSHAEGNCLFGLARLHECREWRKVGCGSMDQLQRGPAQLFFQLAKGRNWDLQQLRGQEWAGWAISVFGFRPNSPILVGQQLGAKNHFSESQGKWQMLRVGALQWDPGGNWALKVIGPIQFLKLLEKEKLRSCCVVICGFLF